MKSYHFSFGNSYPGPIGYCARVKADSPDEAVEILRESISHEFGIPYNSSGRIEYAEAYLNPDAITVADIDEEPEEIDEDEMLTDE